MEVITPEEKTNNQNVDLNNSNGLNEFAKPIEKPLLFKFFDFINSFIFELVLIALFSLIILTIFNYFNIIPLSSIFPPLSFLPQQNSSQAIINQASQDDITFFNNSFSNLASCKNSDTGKKLILNQIITCNDPQKFTNVSNKATYPVIPNTDDPSLIGKNGVQINLALKAQGNGKDDIGIIFGGDAKENRFCITFFPSQNSWGIKFLSASISANFIPIYSPTLTSIAQRAFFSINVSGDGKTISTVFPNGVLYSYSGDKSFFAKDGSLRLSTILNKNSEITIYNLNYYTP